MPPLFVSADCAPPSEGAGAVTAELAALVGAAGFCAAEPAQPVRAAPVTTTAWKSLEGAKFMGPTLPKRPAGCKPRLPPSTLRMRGGARSEIAAVRSVTGHPGSLIGVDEAGEARRAATRPDEARRGPARPGEPR